MARLFTNLKSGDVDDNPLTAGATTLTSAELASLPLVTGGDTLELVLDPLGAGNGPEIVTVTAHSTSATTATITRGQHGTTAVQHALTTAWVAGLVAADLERLDTIEADDWVTTARIAAGAVGNAEISAVAPGKISAGTAAIGISGNSATATRLATARTIDITGDITAAAVAFDGSASIAISAAVNNDSHSHTGATISALAAGDTTSGVFSTARIPSLNASKINAGVFGTARIPDLNASKIDAGTFGAGNYAFPDHVTVQDSLGVGSAFDPTRAFLVMDGLASEMYRLTSAAGDGIVTFKSDIGGTRNEKATIFADGDASFDGVVTDASDERLKKNFVPVAGALAEVGRWRFYDFDWRDGGYHGNTRGVKAQEFRINNPELVREGLKIDDDNPEGFLGVSYLGMVPTIAVAVQELAAQVASLLEV